jgi:hypothetical protein
VSSLAAHQTLVPHSRLASRLLHCSNCVIARILKEKANKRSAHGACTRAHAPTHVEIGRKRLIPEDEREHGLASRILAVTHVALKRK